MSARVPPAIAAAAYWQADLMPLEPHYRSNTPRRSLCLRCFRIVTSAFKAIKNAKGPGCVYCIGNRVDPAAAKHRMRQNGFEPLEPYESTLTRWTVRCRKTGQTVTPSLADVTLRGHSCSACKTVMMRKPRKLGGMWIKDIDPTRYNQQRY